MAKVSLILDTKNIKNNKVLVNGTDLAGITTGIHVDWIPGKLPKVTLDVISDLNFSAKCDFEETNVNIK